MVFCPFLGGRGVYVCVEGGGGAGGEVLGWRGRWVGEEAILVSSRVLRVGVWGLFADLVFFHRACFGLSHCCCPAALYTLCVAYSGGSGGTAASCANCPADGSRLRWILLVPSRLAWERVAVW